MNRSAGRWLPGAGALVLWAFVMALGGCRGAPPPQKPDRPPPELRVEVVAAPDVNRDPAGRALPVVVRVYQLRVEGAFAAAEFYGLYDKEAATLGSDLVSREEITLAPGQRRTLVQPLSPQVTHLGLVAGFRAIDRANWRALVVLRPGEDNAVQVEVGAAAITARLR